MANGKDKNYISFWGWMFILFLAALPCIGIVVVIVLALVGENETRKNYFRALLAWFLILTVFWGLIMVLGLLPVIMQAIHQQWIHFK